MAIDTLQAAKYLAKKSGWKYTNLELQKLLYIAHMIHLGKTGNPLLEDAFEAWNYGPVIPGLYYFLKSYLAKSIPEYVFNGIEDLNEQEHAEEVKVLDTVAKAFQHPSAGLLVAFTHENIGAWYRKYEPGTRDMIIPNLEIAAEYTRRIQEQREYARQ